MHFSIIVFFLARFAINSIAAPIEIPRTLILSPPFLLRSYPALPPPPPSKPPHSPCPSVPNSCTFAKHETEARAVNYPPLEGADVPELGEIFEGHKTAAEHKAMGSY